MDNVSLWYLILGTLLILISISSTFFEKIPLTTSIVYFLIGIGLGTDGISLINADLVERAKLFEHTAEIVVLISLFVAGLKLRLPFTRAHWETTLRLAFISMTITVALIALFAYYVLNLPVGAAVLLGAILAPTDPVLASGVQVKHPEDRDRLRFSLTGEAGLNDGTAFPYVMLGLGLLGLHELGDYNVRWITVDLLWASFAGLAIGWLLGTVVTRFVVYLRERNKETVIIDDFLAMGLIALSYGLAHISYAYGFLAVFAAGLSMRKIEKHEKSDTIKSSHIKSETISSSVRSFTEQLERLGEIASVILLGVIFEARYFSLMNLLTVAAILLFIRPLSVYLGLVGVKMGYYRKPLIAWFGIRGIGSIYYLAYSLNHGVEGDLAQTIAAIVYCAVIISIFVHGISGLPFMALYQNVRSGKRAVSSSR